MTGAKFLNFWISFALFVYLYLRVNRLADGLMWTNLAVSQASIKANGIIFSLLSVSTIDNDFSVISNGN